VIHNADGKGQTERHLRELLDDVRVQATAIAVVAPSGQSFPRTVADWSANTDLSLLGMSRPPAAERSAYAERLNQMIDAVGTVLLVHSASEEKLLADDL